jgi:twitching motility two-component system response regulator PilH
MPIKNILVVDDSSTERLYLSEILSRNGYAVTAASGAEEALARVRASLPDLILMDVVMPGTNGYQLTRQLARDPATEAVPIILCTSKGQPTDRLWGLRQGARDYLVKPVESAELLDKIAALDRGGAP